jgi:hypothetical protein
MNDGERTRNEKRVASLGHMVIQAFGEDDVND